jgi:ring-1,2-phenylacetyl-CoA epoxidase subunit PaaD
MVKAAMTLTEKQAWEALMEVKDPEIPVVSVVELGIVQKVEVSAERVKVTITPTFSGCPALRVMQDEIESSLLKSGAKFVDVEVSNNPPWSSDQITPEGRAKLMDFGLSPPPRHGGMIELSLLEVVSCPYCGSENTSLKNNFGPTLCRAIFVCNNCTQPFEQFKPI